MFTHTDIRGRVRETPFVPFRIVTSSGQAFDITHPDLMFVGRRDVMVGTASTEEPTYYDGLTRLAILHITAIQDLPVASPLTGNGQQ